MTTKQTAPATPPAGMSAADEHKKAIFAFFAVMQDQMEPATVQQAFAEMGIRVVSINEPAIAASLAVPVPTEATQEANAAITAMLKEYNYPSNPQNAGRAGWRAARLYAAPLASPAHTDHGLRHYDRTCPACNPPTPPKEPT